MCVSFQPVISILISSFYMMIINMIKINDINLWNLWWWSNQNKKRFEMKEWNGNVNQWSQHLTPKVWHKQHRKYCCSGGGGGGGSGGYDTLVKHSYSVSTTLLAYVKAPTRWVVRLVYSKSINKPSITTQVRVDSLVYVPLLWQLIVYIYRRRYYTHFVHTSFCGSDGAKVAFFMMSTVVEIIIPLFRWTYTGFI